MRYVVDTSVINKFVDGSLAPEHLPDDGDYLASHVQVDELNKTKDEERRARLFLKFATTINNIVPTESLVVGVSRIGQCKISDGILYGVLKSGLGALNGAKSNNSIDALIAEVAIKNGYTLITADYHLQKVSTQHGCRVIYNQIA